ncbi:putative mitochondrial protein [Tanacetum coccineum]
MIKHKRPLKLLSMPNFNEEFVIETDASDSGIGAVLQQQGHLIAYLSKALAPKHFSLSTYEKELLVVIHALEKWRGYLLDKHFKIKTDHFSLKTGSLYPKTYWELLPKEILGATTQRDTGRYCPKRYWELLPKEISGAITQRDTGSCYPKRDWDVLWENGGNLVNNISG